MLENLFFVGLMEPTTIDICQDILEREGWLCSDPDSPTIQLYLQPEDDQFVSNGLFEQAIIKDGNMFIKQHDRDQTAGYYYGKYNTILTLLKAEFHYGTKFEITE